MKRLAEDLFLIAAFPRQSVNAYLLGDVLVDAAVRQSAGLILRKLRDHKIQAHALTHAHPDHQGSSHAICEKLGVPFWCGAGDADAAEDPSLIPERLPNRRLAAMSYRLAAGSGHPVARILREGDEIGGFTVLEVPGHSAGHLAFWRPSDRALVLGDVLNNMNLFTTRPGLREPPRVFTPDPARNRVSARKLGALEPALVCFGHGPPLRDTGAFVRFVESLPRD